MGTRYIIAADGSGYIGAFYNSTDGVAFGPVVSAQDESELSLLMDLVLLGRDPRDLDLDRERLRAMDEHAAFCSATDDDFRDGDGFDSYVVGRRNGIAAQTLMQVAEKSGDLRTYMYYREHNRDHEFALNAAVKDAQDRRVYVDQMRRERGVAS